MTRSHKANDPSHGVTEPQGAQDTVPRNFGKHAAHTDPPNKAKKNGGGKANWLVTLNNHKLYYCSIEADNLL